MADSSTESGAQHEIYVRAFPDDGRRWKISDGGGTVPQWAETAPRSLMFQAPDRSLRAAPYSTTSHDFVPGAPHVWSTVRTAADATATSVFTVASHGARVAALVSEHASEERARHVATLWTNVLDEFDRRLAVQKRR